jgi:hypothetical protein
MKIIFFNQFHNGDCFVGKSYVRDLIEIIKSRRSDIEFEYAHNNHPGILADVPADYTPVHGLPVDRMLRIGTAGDDIYINTWVGCWQGEIFGFGEHINFKKLHEIWRRYYAALSRLLSMEIPFGTDPQMYVPYIDEKFYRTDLIRNYQQGYAKKRKVLICNGPANSGQSQMGNFIAEIDALSKEYPDIQFIATERTGIRRLNVSHTADIFSLDSDLNEIALLSRHCDLIVGKNSGPYSFAHHRANVFDATKTFICFSTQKNSCLDAEQDWPAEFLFSDKTMPADVMTILRYTIEKHVLTKPQAL